MKILDGIAKVLAFIMLKLGLWLATVYTIAFFIVSGVSGIPLTGLTMGLFWAGLAFTAVVGFTLSVYIRARRNAKRAEASGVVPEKKFRQSKKEKRRAETSQSQIMNSQGVMPPQGYAGQYPPPYGYYPPYQQPPAQGYAPPPQYSMPQQPYQQPPQQQPQYQAPPQQSAARDVSDLERKYFPEKTREYERTAEYSRTASFDENSFMQSYGKTMTKTQQLAADSKFDSDDLWRRLSGADIPDEQPLVFRTRKDPDLYVYEYSDRYQYWRRTNSGMVFESTEFKTTK